MIVMCACLLTTDSAHEVEALANSNLTRTATFCIVGYSFCAGILINTDELHVRQRGLGGPTGHAMADALRKVRSAASELTTHCD